MQLTFIILLALVAGACCLAEVFKSEYPEAR
jgi:hypothetical protein